MNLFFKRFSLLLRLLWLCWLLWLVRVLRSRLVWRIHRLLRRSLRLPWISWRLLRLNWSWSRLLWSLRRLLRLSRRLLRLDWGLLRPGWSSWLRVRPGRLLRRLLRLNGRWLRRRSWSHWLSWSWVQSVIILNSFRSLMRDNFRFWVLSSVFSIKISFMDLSWVLFFSGWSIIMDFKLLNCWAGSRFSVGISVGLGRLVHSLDSLESLHLLESLGIWLFLDCGYSLIENNQVWHSRNLVESGSLLEIWVGHINCE